MLNVQGPEASDKIHDNPSDVQKDPTELEEEKGGADPEASDKIHDNPSDV